MPRLLPLFNIEMEKNPSGVHRVINYSIEIGLEKIDSLRFAIDPNTVDNDYESIVYLRSGSD